MKKTLMAISIIGIIILVSATFVLLKNEDWNTKSEFGLQIEEQTISIWESEGIKYVFIPGGLEQEKLYFSTYGNTIYIDDCLIEDGQAFDFSYNEIHKLSTEKDNDAEIVFIKTSNLATMFISSVDGLDQIYKSKDEEEQVRIDLYDEEGVLDYHSTETKIKCRGNTTWSLEKKPYTLTLKDESSLLDMGEACKYVLLANAYDESNLKNKIVYDFARKVNYGWSPNAKFVDLYIDGEYQGLYLLTEKIEVDDKKLDFSDDTYLLCESYENRWRVLSNPIKTDAGRVFSIEYPKIIPDSKLYDINQNINMIEKRIDSNEDVIFDMYGGVDLDSFAKKYLIEEIFMNSDLASLYFIYNEEENILYAGPAWDYDNAFGTSSLLSYKLDWKSFLMNQLRKRDSDIHPWYSYLYWNEQFYSEVVSIYETEYLPLLEQLIDSGISEYGNEIQESSNCNSLRWKKMFDNYIYYSEVQDIEAFLHERVQFLNSAWIEGKEYCTVRLNLGDGSEYKYYSVPKGSVYDNYPTKEMLGISIEASFIDEKTGKEYDFSKVVNEDQSIIVVINYEAIESTSDDDQQYQESPLLMIKHLILEYEMEILYGIVILVFVSIFCTLIYAEIRRSSNG